MSLIASLIQQSISWNEHEINISVSRSFFCPQSSYRSYLCEYMPLLSHYVALTGPHQSPLFCAPPLMSVISQWAVSPLMSDSFVAELIILDSTNNFGSDSTGLVKKKKKKLMRSLIFNNLLIIIIIILIIIKSNNKNNK